MTIAIVGNESGQYPAVLDEVGLFVDTPIQFGPAPPLGLGSLLGGQVNVPGTGDTWKRIRQADFRGGAGQERQVDLSRYMQSDGLLMVGDMDTRLALELREDDDSGVTWPGGWGQTKWRWHDYLVYIGEQTWLVIDFYCGGSPDVRMYRVDTTTTSEDTSPTGHMCEGKSCLYGWHDTSPMMIAKWQGAGTWTNFTNQPPWSDDNNREEVKVAYWDEKVWNFLGRGGGAAADHFHYCWSDDEGASAWPSLEDLDGTGRVLRLIPYARQLLICWDNRLDGFAGKQYVIEDFRHFASGANFRLAVVYRGVFYFNIGTTIMAYSGSMRELVRSDPPLAGWHTIRGGAAYDGVLYFATHYFQAPCERAEIWAYDLATGALHRLYSLAEEEELHFFYYPGLTHTAQFKVLENRLNAGVKQMLSVQMDDNLDSGNEDYNLETGHLYLSWADAGYPELNKTWGYVAVDCECPTNTSLTVKYSTDGDSFTTLGTISGPFDGVETLALPSGVVETRVQFLVEFDTTNDDDTPILRELTYGVALAPDNKHRIGMTVMAMAEIAEGSSDADYGEQMIRLLESKARRVVQFDWIGPRAIQLYDGATYSDELDHATTEDDGGSDYIDLSDATTSYELYILSMIPFSVIKVWMISGSGNGNAATLDLEYYNGSSWTDVPRFTDGTASGGATLAQDGDIVVDDIPDDMELVTVNGETGFGYRLKWSAALDADCKIDVVQVACRYFLELENVAMEIGLEDEQGTRIYEGRVPVTLTEV